MKWIIRRGEMDCPCANIDELRTLATEGQISPLDQLFDPRSQKWTTAQTVIELIDLFQIDKTSVTFIEFSTLQKCDGIFSMSKSTLFYSYNKLKFNLFVRFIIIIIFAVFGSIISFIASEALQDVSISRPIIFCSIIMIGWSITKKTILRNGEIQLNAITRFNFEDKLNRIDIYSTQGNISILTVPVVFNRIQQLLPNMIPKS